MSLHPQNDISQNSNFSWLKKWILLVPKILKPMASKNTSLILKNVILKPENDIFRPLNNTFRATKMTFLEPQNATEEPTKWQHNAIKVVSLNPHNGEFSRPTNWNIWLQKKSPAKSHKIDVVRPEKWHP